MSAPRPLLRRRALRCSARTSSALRALRALRGLHILRADCAGCTRCAARTSSALRALHALGALGATYCTLRAKVLRGKTFDWCTVTWSAFSLTSEPWRLRGLLTVPSDCQWYTRSCRAGASWKSWKSWSRCAARISSTLQALRALARASRFALKMIFGSFLVHFRAQIWPFEGVSGSKNDQNSLKTA